MTFKLIFAQSENGFIGKDNRLLFDIPEDMRYFREQTKGDIVIMGRKTWESLPPQFRPLPGRINFIVSRTMEPYCGIGAYVIDDLEKLLKSTDKFFTSLQRGTAWVIGGSEVYNHSLPYVDEIHQTMVFEEVQGDSVAPEIDLNVFEKISSSEIKEHVGLKYQFNVYKRKNHGKAECESSNEERSC